MKILLRKMKTFLNIIKAAIKPFNSHVKNFGLKLALIELWDDMHVIRKSPRYIQHIEDYVDEFFKEFIIPYQTLHLEKEETQLEEFPVWLCWWQGVDTMPEIVKMCYTRLQSKLPNNVKLHVITVDNYLEYIDLPEHIVRKFNNKVITMATMSDILRMSLLSRYGGYWIDATVFYTGDIPEEYFNKEFYCQKMFDLEKCAREACKGRWCGFSMAGRNDNVLFHFMKDGFIKWWEEYDDIPDYVLIDYMILTAYKHIPSVKECIDSVENNNEDIFEMYTHLNEPYTEELYNYLTRNNVMHKLTYKMDLHKYTNDGQLTLYGYLLKDVFGEDYE